jgi:hypothetical protein
MLHYDTESDEVVESGDPILPSTDEPEVDAEEDTLEVEDDDDDDFEDDDDDDIEVTIEEEKAQDASDVAESN